jgi:hypothetical protein
MQVCKIKNQYKQNKKRDMKYIKNTGWLITVGALVLVTNLTSCKKDFFDIKDPQGIDSEIWNDEGAIGLFLNRTYSLVMANDRRYSQYI